MADRIGALHDAVRAAADGDYPVWVGGHVAQVREIVALGRRLERLGRYRGAVRGRRDARARGRARCDAHVGRSGADRRNRRRRARESRDAFAGADVLVGGPERIAEQLEPFVEHGAEWIILGPIDSSKAENATILGEISKHLTRICDA